VRVTGGVGSVGGKAACPVAADAPMGPGPGEGGAPTGAPLPGVAAVVAPGSDTGAPAVGSGQTATSIAPGDAAPSAVAPGGEARPPRASGSPPRSRLGARARSTAGRRKQTRHQSCCPWGTAS